MSTQADAYDDVVAQDKADTGAQTQHDREVARQKIRVKVKKLETEISGLDVAIKFNEEQLLYITRELNARKKRVVDYDAEHPVPRSYEEGVEFDNLVKDVNDQKKVWRVTKDTLDRLNKQKKTKQDEKSKLNAQLRLPSGHGSSWNGKKPITTTITDKNDSAASSKNEKPDDKPPAKPIAMTGGYKYNAPMVKEAYFSFNGIQDRLQNGTTMDRFNYNDAQNAWKGTVGAVGTIQMDRDFVQQLAPTVQAATADKKNKLPKFDNQLYGFRFLYNPTSVGMAWGMQQETVPSFEASGQDKSYPISAGLVTSTVSFSLMLNRIEDFNHIKSDGSWVSDADKERSQTLNESNLPDFAKNPLNNVVGAYPTPVSQAERKMIYDRGTMYDIEYLMRTIMGPSPDFKSLLNGTTADRGWLRPTVVELHLGAGMRYRVRIDSLSVNHAVFDSRMVPILSTVNITAKRFNDFSTITAKTDDKR
jgi:hypothetical protein